MTDTITLRFPARGDQLVLARLVTSALASRAGMDVDEIDDLRLAVDELCLSVMREVPGGQLTLELEQGTGTVSISCAFVPPEGGKEDADGVLGPDHGTLAELSTRILDALVDEHDRFGSDGTAEARAWLIKRAATRP